jgi:membrane protein YdbS with pleckstrin-like domain
MPTRTLVELLHLAAGLVATVAVGSVCGWAYPQAWQTIWCVAAVGFAIVAIMGVRPLRRAWRADSADKARRGDG